MRTSELFPSDYLRVSDLAGRARIYTIKDCTMESIGSDKETKPVLWFKETTLGMVLNKTNTRAIEAIYGDDTDAWQGRRITIRPATTDFQGKPTPCLRVQTPPPVLQPAPAAPPAGAVDEPDPDGVVYD